MIEKDKINLPLVCCLGQCPITKRHIALPNYEIATHATNSI